MKDCPKCWHEADDPMLPCACCGHEFVEQEFTEEDWEEFPEVVDRK